MASLSFDRKVKFFKQRDWKFLSQRKTTGRDFNRHGSGHRSIPISALQNRSNFCELRDAAQGCFASIFKQPLKAICRRVGRWSVGEKRYYSLHKYVTVSNESSEGCRSPIVCELAEREIDIVSDDDQTPDTLLGYGSDAEKDALLLESSHFEAIIPHELTPPRPSTQPEIFPAEAETAALTISCNVSPSREAHAVLNNIAAEKFRVRSYVEQSNHHAKSLLQHLDSSLSSLAGHVFSASQRRVTTQVTKCRDLAFAQNPLRARSEGTPPFLVPTGSNSDMHQSLMSLILGRNFEDLADLEEFLQCYVRLYSPFFLEMVNRLFSDVCNEILESERIAEAAI